MEEGVKAQKGYSIWSLLVIMTLLAVWLAVPRFVPIDRWPGSLQVFFILFHQIMIWALIASVIWLATGRRRIVMYLLSVMIAFLWSPMVLMVAEDCFFDSQHMINWLVRSGFANAYHSIIWVFSL